MVDEPVQLLHLVECLGDLELKVADVAAQVVTLVSLDLVGDVEPVDLLQVFPVAIAESAQFVLALPLVRLELSVVVMADLQLMIDPLDVHVTVGDELPLPVELLVQLSVLTLPVVVDRALFVHFGSKGLDEANVGIDTRLVVLVHASLVFVEPTEILLHVHKLVLEGLVVALFLAQIGRFLHELGDHALLFGGSSSASG